MDTVSIIVLASIVSSIIIGYCFKINIGLLVMVCAYFIGVFVMGLPVNDIIAMWPTSLFFMIMSISLFYGFAIANGTLQKIAELTVYKTRNKPYLIPIALFLLAMVVAGIGPGAYAVFIFLSPLVLSIAKSTKMSTILASVILLSGGGAGGFSRLSVGGVVIQNLVSKAGYSEQATTFGDKVFIIALIAHGALFIAVYILTKGYKLKAVDITKPEAFTKKQKTNIVIIVFTLLYVIIPVSLASIMPKSSFLQMLQSKVDVTFSCLMGVILALIFKVGNERDAITFVPWSTLLLICGMGIIIEIAVKAGSIQALAEWIISVDVNAAPILLILISAILGSVASTLGVVMPAMYTTVPVIANSIMLDPALLFALITIAGTFTSYNPVSSAGAILLSNVESEEEYKIMFIKLFIFTIINTVVLCLVAFLII